MVSKRSAATLRSSRATAGIAPTATYRVGGGVPSPPEGCARLHQLTGETALQLRYYGARTGAALHPQDDLCHVAVSTEAGLVGLGFSRMFTDARLHAYAAQRCTTAE